MKVAPRHRQEAARSETIQALRLLNDDVDPSHASVVNLLSDATGAAVTLFTVIDGDQQHFAARRGLDAAGTPRVESICAHAIVQDDALFVAENLAEDERFSDFSLHDGSGRPLRFYAGAVVNAPNGLPVGTVCILDAEPGPLAAADRRRLLEAKQLVESSLELQLDSNRDHLTSLYNRRYFDELLNREWRRAIRHMVPFTLLLLDIDHFGAYNDRFGHPAGDDALKAVAGVLRTCLRRPSDLCARYGGEEFIVMLPESDLEAAQLMADRIRDAVRDLGLEHPDTDAGVITISAGGAVAVSRAHLAFGASRLIELADEALYAAKDAGRDATRIVAVDPSRID